MPAIFTPCSIIYKEGLSFLGTSNFPWLMEISLDGYSSQHAVTHLLACIVHSICHIKPILLKLSALIQIRIMRIFQCTTTYLLVVLYRCLHRWRQKWGKVVDIFLIVKKAAFSSSSDLMKKCEMKHVKSLFNCMVFLHLSNSKWSLHIKDIYFMVWRNT